MNTLKKNIPVLIIGVIVAIVFVVITVIGQSRDSETTLVDAITSTFNVTQKETPTSDEPIPEYVAQNMPSATDAPPEDLKKTDVSSTYPVLEIEFTETGFKPNSSNARTGQIVRWVNKTEREIQIKELIPKYPAFAVGLKIQPGESFEQLLNVQKIWTYEELGSGLIGKLIIFKGTL
jgi:hypothetical protein